MQFFYSKSFFGIGLDAYLIIIVLGIPLFFIWREVFKKKIVSKRKRVIVTWLMTVFSTPLVYTVIILIWFLAGNYYPNHNFEKACWINNKDDRYELCDDIIGSKILIGKTKAAVKNLLGDESNKEDSDDWFYDLGFTPGSIDPDSMEIKFKSEKVESVVRHKHH
jgi:hypothetical protein